MSNKASDEANYADKRKYGKSTDDDNVARIASNSNEAERTLYRQYIEKLKKYNRKKKR